MPGCTRVRGCRRVFKDILHTRLKLFECLFNVPVPSTVCQCCGAMHSSLRIRKGISVYVFKDMPTRTHTPWDSSRSPKPRPVAPPPPPSFIDPFPLGRDFLNGMCSIPHVSGPRRRDRQTHGLVCQRSCYNGVDGTRGRPRKEASLRNIFLLPKGKMDARPGEIGTRASGGLHSRPGRAGEGRGAGEEGG